MASRKIEWIKEQELMWCFKFILFVFIGCLFSGLVFGQSENPGRDSIKTYVRKIDSIINPGQIQPVIIRSIEEGLITQEQKSIIKTKHNRKADTLIVHNKGGWSRYVYSNLKEDTVYKICYHDNLFKNYLLTFYYRDNQLVYSLLELQEGGGRSTIYTREELYSNGQLINTSEAGNKSEGAGDARINIPLYATGSDYLNGFINKAYPH